MSVDDGSGASYPRSLESYIARLAEANNIPPEKALLIFRLLARSGASRGLSDEDLEALTGYRQSEIRRILRLLYENRVISYRKGRHPKSDATRYYWSIDYESINITLVRVKKNVLSKLKMRLEFEEGNSFYVCPNDGNRYTFDEALENDFSCPRCGSILDVDYEAERIKEYLRMRITELEKEIESDENHLYSS